MFDEFCIIFSGNESIITDTLCLCICASLYVFYCKGYYCYDYEFQEQFAVIMIPHAVSFSKRRINSGQDDFFSFVKCMTKD